MRLKKDLESLGMFMYSVDVVANLWGGENMVTKHTLKSSFAEATHEEVAKQVNLTRNTVIQVEKRAMEKFKKAMAQKNIQLKDLL